MTSVVSGEDGPSMTDEEKLDMIKRKPIVFVLGKSE